MIDCSENTVIKFRRGHRHELEDSYAKTGANWEDWASQKLIENGISNIPMPHKHPFDILADNGARIEVKSAIKNIHPLSYKHISPVWQFHIKTDTHKANDCDFYLLIIVPLEKIFIIPTVALPRMDQLRFCYPTARPTMFKWAEYENAYHLIMEYHAQI